MDFPGQGAHLPVISVLSAEALGSGYRLQGGVAPVSNGWVSANRAIYVPFSLSAPYQVSRVWWANGATATGNVDCGIYTIGGTRLASTGSTAQAGTSVVQSVALSQLLLPGAYYMALVLSSTSGTILRAALAVVGCQSLGVAQQATALPLPATATFATVASAFMPLFGIASASVI